MGNILSFINPNIPPDELGRKTGYRVSGVNINDDAGILNLAWKTCKYKNGDISLEDFIVSSRVEQVTDSLPMKKFDSDGNVLTEQQPVYSDVQIGIDGDGNPIMERQQTGTETVPQMTGAYTQWIKILKQEIKNVPIEVLISNFILGMES